MSLPGNGPKAALPKKKVNCYQCCGALTIYYGSVSDLRQDKVPVPVCSGSVPVSSQ